MFPQILAIAFLGCAFAAPPDDAGCGTTPIPPSQGNFKDEEGRIVGGKEAVKNSWPWQVQIQYDKSHFCGASMLSTNWIVSAAHCFRGFDSSRMSFHFGKHYSNVANEATEKSSTAAQVIQHESYSSLTKNNDIAVIRMTTSIAYSNAIRPVCLPLTGVLAAGTNVHVTGWGETEGTGSPFALKQVMVPIVSTATCNQRDYYNGAITDGMICAGLDAGGRDSCQGDSGGPLVFQSSSKWQLFGVVSWGSGCAEPKKPGVYSNVVYYEAWVRSKVTMVERDEELVSEKFRPMPAGAAFREQAREQVLIGAIEKADLPANGEWLE